MELIDAIYTAARARGRSRRRSSVVMLIPENPGCGSRLGNHAVFEMADSLSFRSNDIADPQPARRLE